MKISLLLQKTSIFFTFSKNQILLYKMAQHEMDFGFTNVSKNIDSYGDIAFLKRSQTSRTPCKCMVAYKFFDLLHKNARFWSFLALF